MAHSDKRLAWEHVQTADNANLGIHSVKCCLCGGFALDGGIMTLYIVRSL